MEATSNEIIKRLNLLETASSSDRYIVLYEQLDIGEFRDKPRDNHEKCVEGRRRFEALLEANKARICEYYTLHKVSIRSREAMALVGLAEIISTFLTGLAVATFLSLVLDVSLDRVCGVE